MEAAAPARRHCSDDNTASSALEQALSLVLKNPAMAADFQAVCRLRQVCKSWHAIVQQSTGPLAVTVTASLQHLAAFAVWLRKCPSLVKSIKITGTAENQQIAAALLQLALHGAADVGAAAAANQKGSSWQLQSFQCSSMGRLDIVSTGVLLALPASTLTKLVLGDCSLGPGAQAAIRRLSQLISLSMVGDDIGFLATMTSLTTLSIKLDEGAPSLSQLPQQLQQLSLEYPRHVAEAPVINLEHLTRLSSLELTVTRLSEPASVSLPTQLQVVDICTDQPGVSVINSFGLAQLRQLRILDLTSHGAAMEPLELLGGHTQLQVLKFTKENDYLGSLAPAWGLLKGLRKLHLWMGVRSCMEMSEFAGALSKCGSLMKLSLWLDFACRGAPAAAATSTWELLAGLTNLQNLEIDIHLSSSAERVSLCCGISHLGKLTQLTRLSLDLDPDLDSLDSGLHLPADVADLAWMLGRLTRLEHLSLRLGSSDAVGWDVALLPTVGQLSRLRHLHWPRLQKGPARRGLLFLSDLHELTCLDGFNAAGPSVQKRFSTCFIR